MATAVIPSAIIKDMAHTSIQPGISHDRAEESPAAKARWFQSLTEQERMEMLCWFTDLALASDPNIAERKHVEPAPGRIRVVEAA